MSINQLLKLTQIQGVGDHRKREKTKSPKVGKPKGTMTCRGEKKKKKEGGTTVSTKKGDKKPATPWRRGRQII